VELLKLKEPYMKAWNDEICHHTTSTPHK